MAAINKRKLLESAQRHLQKGAVDKALADYQAVLQADPRDTNVRLKVGDLLQKAGRNDEAIAAYLKVADQFQRDGFDAKAVALYKQVTKIDPKRHDVYVPLADLYQRLGLVSEAMGALQVAAEAYQREGRKREALDLLRRMASLDPGNVTSRLKVAELLKQEGLVEEAVAEFREAAAELDRQGDWEARANVLERIIELRPEAIDELEALARLWLDHDQARRAHGVAQKLVAADPSRPDSLEILAHAYAGLGQEELAIDAFRQCAEAWRMRGEEDKAREIVQRHLPTQDFASLAAPVPEATGGVEAGASADLFGGSDELGAEAPAGEGMFGSEPIELDGSGVVDLGAGARDFENDMAVVREGASLRDDSAPAPPAAPPPADTERTSAPAAPRAAPAAAAAAGAASDAGAEDLEQLLAEAAVYARYGKHERALACLEKALAQQPDHGGALEQLGEVHAAAGASEQAVTAWVRAAELAAAAGDAARVVVLRERIEALDPAAAAGLPLPSAGDGGAGEEPAASAADTEQASDDEGLGDIEIDVDDSALATSDGAEGGAGEDIDLELDLDGAEASPAASAADAPAVAHEPEAASAPASPPAAAADDDDIVFDGEDSASETAAPSEASAEEQESPAPRELAWELDDDDTATEGVAAGAPTDAAGTAQPEPAGEEVSASTAQQIQEDREEAGFYFDQGLLNEAEAVYRRILARAPSHPGALLRLGEIAVRRGDPAAAGATSVAETPVAPPPAPPVAAAPREPAPEIEPPDALDLTAPTLDDAAWARPMEAPAGGDDATTAGLAAPAGAGDDATLRPTPAAEPPPAPASPPPPPPPATRVAAQAAPPAFAAPAADEPELTARDLAQEQDGPGASFDLAAELSEALSEPSTRGGAADDDGFASLFREFKRGVSQTLGEHDVETHFDLGIAYREMGLFEDAIGEFRYALGSPARRIDALQLMALCALDLGRAQDAVGHLEQALASPDVPPEREAPLRYELGRAYEALPDRVRALAAFQRVQQLDPGFQDVAERVAALERGEAGAPTPGADAETYESFDDLVAEATEEAAAPAYESFDDVVAEANEDEDDVPSADPPLAATLAADSDAADDDTEPDAASGRGPAQPAEPTAPAQRRRRKVSFV